MNQPLLRAQEKIICVNPWLILVNVWQKSLQYCQVISLQLIKKKKDHLCTCICVCVCVCVSCVFFPPHSLPPSLHGFCFSFLFNSGLKIPRLFHCSEPYRNFEGSDLPRYTEWKKKKSHTKIKWFLGIFQLIAVLSPLIRWLRVCTFHW